MLRCWCYGCKVPIDAKTMLIDHRTADGAAPLFLSGEEPMESSWKRKANIVKWHQSILSSQTNQISRCNLQLPAMHLLVECYFHLPDFVHTRSENSWEVWQPTSNFMYRGRWLVVELAENTFPNCSLKQTWVGKLLSKVAVRWPETANSGSSSLLKSRGLIFSCSTKPGFGHNVMKLLACCP